MMKQVKTEQSISGNGCYGLWGIPSIDDGFNRSGASRRNVFE
jgi:hypothetical protein